MIKERITQLIDSEGYIKEDFFGKIGMTSANFRGKAKETPINSTAIENILSVVPRVNLDWLITGNGNMYNSEPTKEGASIKPRSVPLLPIEGIAGYPNTDNEGITYEDCEQYSVPEFDDRGYEFVIRVSGSSMYPKYSNGDILACKKVHDILFFQWGKVYVIDSSQGALVKRVFEDKNDPDKILLVSDNRENYPPFSVPKSDIRSLSLVLGVIRVE